MQASTAADPRGLRERKKERTRQAIIGAAMSLYRERGYEGVTIAEIARRADVAPRTFFGYFASKEDVFLGRGDDRLERLIRAIRGRERDLPILTAVQRELVAGEQPVGERPRSGGPQLDELLEQPAIRHRLRERWNRWEDALATAIAEDVGADAGDPEPRLLAAVVTAAIRIAAEAAGSRPTRRLDVAARVFDLIASGLADYGAAG